MLNHISWKNIGFSGHEAEQTWGFHRISAICVISLPSELSNFRQSSALSGFCQAKIVVGQNVGLRRHSILGWRHWFTYTVLYNNGFFEEDNWCHFWWFQLVRLHFWDTFGWLNIYLECLIWKVAIEACWCGDNGVIYTTYEWQRALWWAITGYTPLICSPDFFSNF